MIGAVGQYLQIQPGPPSSCIVDVIMGSLRGQLRAALFSVFNRGETATIYHHPDDEGQASSADLGRMTVTVEPVAPETLDGAPSTTESYVLITFEAVPTGIKTETGPIDTEDGEQSETRLNSRKMSVLRFPCRWRTRRSRMSAGSFGSRSVIRGLEWSRSFKRSCSTSLPRSSRA